MIQPVGKYIHNIIHTFIHNKPGNPGWFTVSAEAEMYMLLHWGNNLIYKVKG